MPSHGQLPTAVVRADASVLEGEVLERMLLVADQEQT
eukprot:COSAG06_NODE_43037_length_376_cov_0.559567_1_plen_36_part_10